MSVFDSGIFNQGVVDNNAVTLIDPLFVIAPNKIDSIRRSRDPQGTIGALTVEPAHLTLHGGQVFPTRFYPVQPGHLTLTSKTSAHDRTPLVQKGALVFTGRSVVLNSVLWTAIPTQDIDRSGAYPKFITGIKAAYLLGTATSVSMVGIDVGVISYDAANDRVVIASDPGSNVTDNVQMRAVTPAGNVDSNVFAINLVASANQPPVWNSQQVFNLTVGQPFALDLDQLAADPEGQQLTFSTVAGGLPAGIVASGARSNIVSGTPTTAQTTSPTIRANDAPAGSPAAALADWNARSTALGVVKALRFPDQTNVLKYSSAPAASQNVTPAERAAALENIFYRAGDGIIGDGCMEHFYPAGLNRFISWNLPLAPFPTDINRPGLPTITDPTNGSQPYWWPLGYNSLRGGFFAHPSHMGPLVQQSTWPGAPQGGNTIVGHEFWIQFRIKFSLSSFTDTTAKVLWIDHNVNNNDAALFFDMVTNFTQGHAPSGTGHGGEFRMMTNYGGNEGQSFTRAWNAEMSDIQGAIGSGTKFQTGGAFENTCLFSTTQKGYPATNCWTFIPDEWVTLNIHIKPGPNAKFVQNANNAAACSNPVFDPFRSTIAEVFAARPGAGTWTKVWGRNDFVLAWWSSHQGLQNGWSINEPGVSTPFGFNQMKFSNFNGGGVTTAPVADIWRRMDQIIISTLEPALPAV